MVNTGHSGIVVRRGFALLVLGNSKSCGFGCVKLASAIDSLVVQPVLLDGVEEMSLVKLSLTKVDTRFVCPRHGSQADKVGVHFC